MLPTDDHSLFEILLGAEPYMPAAFAMSFGLRDLGQLWPPGRALRTSDGLIFDAADVWSALARHLGEYRATRGASRLHHTPTRFPPTPFLLQTTPPRSTLSHSTVLYS